MTEPYTPRRHLDGYHSEIQEREMAVKTLLQANRKAPQQTQHYLQGYYDALNLVSDEIKQAKEAEIMGITPGGSDD